MVANIMFPVLNPKLSVFWYASCPKKTKPVQRIQQNIPKPLLSVEIQNHRIQFEIIYFSLEYVYETMELVSFDMNIELSPVNGSCIVPRPTVIILQWKFVFWRAIVDW